MSTRGRPRRAVFVDKTACPVNDVRMAAFGKIQSGLAGLDRALDSIRLGDNVVWQVGSVSDYRALARAFARQAVRDGRRVIYIRFAPHEAIFADDEAEGIVIHKLDPSTGFEYFTGEVHRIAAEAGREAFYVFDSLSELQTAWSADLMMGNFFSVTCPYLFELDTVAWFCIIRHRHSYDAVARVRETTQILIDLFSGEDEMYIHPIKVWKRYSPTMFFPHRLSLSDPDALFPLTDGVSVSAFYRLAGDPGDPGGARNLDSWERFFLEARDEAAKRPEDAARLVRPLAERLFGSDERFMKLVLGNCTARDLFDVKDRMIGSGKIGGKAVGMILARRIVGRALPDVASRMEPHDSFYVGSDVFYTYLVHNRLWRTRIVQRTEAGYFSEAAALREGLLSGTFPERVREQFARMLDYFGQAPIIVRSSSLLEDSFGHAFAGKYESVFCANAGASEERLAAFEDAMRRVYASTMDPSALEYRRLRGLHGQDEQMAILVQRVSGSLYGDFFMPAVAGVGYSLNTWRWHPDLDPSAGMVRLVAGLGTRAVDRTDSDYPRLASLDRPDLPPSGDGDRSVYCQRSLDVVDIRRASVVTLPLEETLSALPDWLCDIISERDYETERRLADSGGSARIRIATCSGAVSNGALTGDLRAMLRALEDEYGNPVDVEFTVNWKSPGEYLVNLLQCRPLQTPTIAAAARPGLDGDFVASLPEEDVLLWLVRDTMGPQLDCDVGAIVYIDPVSYYQMPFRDKPSVARVIGELNARYRLAGGKVVLFAPGRIGTTSPELGVPVSFAEIDAMGILCEVACSSAGYRPELSFGSHFFQDLVESGIFYAAVPEDGPPSRFNPGALSGLTDSFAALFPESNVPPGVVRVYEGAGFRFVSDVVRGTCLCARGIEA